VCAPVAGAAAAGGGALSPALLRAMQDSWADSSSANTADQLADQEAQLRYLQESNALVVAERDQLLTINRRMVSLLVEQIKALSSSSVGTTNSSSGQEPGSNLDVLGQSCAAASCGGSAGVKAGQSAARLRRCLSFEVRSLLSQRAAAAAACFACMMELKVHSLHVEATTVIACLTSVMLQYTHI
jgi:hypothetical protein